MKVYEFRLKPQAAWSTPWHADTLWGSLCWAWREAGGVAELSKLLSRFRSMKPPFVLSDALPAGLLPTPFGAKVEHPEGEKVKADWCSTEDFREWTAGRIGKLTVQDARQRPFSMRSLLHVRMNRNTDAGEPGALFEEDQRFFNLEAYPRRADHLLSIYVRVLPEDGDEKQEAELLVALRECFEILGRKGYGRKASTGLGAFELEGKAERRQWLEVKEGHSGFVSLSHFVPAKDDPRRGHWRVHAKNPKFASNLVPRFLKGNLILLTPGSNFEVAEPVREFYGRMIPMPREGYDEALHYGLAFVAPVGA